MTQPKESENTPNYLYLILLGGFILAVWLGSTMFSLPSTEPVGGYGSDCDLTRQSCTVQMDQVTLTLEIQPHPISTLTPLNYRVIIEGVDVSEVIVSLQGVEMFMGINQTALTAIEGQPGLFEGTGELAICTTGEMLWRLTVAAETTAGPLNTWFEFRAK